MYSTVPQAFFVGFVSAVNPFFVVTKLQLDLLYLISYHYYIMGASVSTISVADFSDAKEIYETKKAEGLSDEELFTQIKAALDAKHHTPPAVVTAIADAHAHDGHDHGEHVSAEPVHA